MQPISSELCQLLTALAIFWERPGRWVVHERADQLRLFLLALAILVVAGLGLVVRVPEMMALGVLGLVLLIYVRRGGRGEIDFERRTLRSGIEAVSFDEISSLAFRTGLELRFRLSPATGRQVWHLDIERPSHPPLRLATHGNELALLRATRRLAARLDRPVDDECGPDGRVTRWHPRQTASRSPRAAGRPPASITERSSGEGTAIDWHIPWLSAAVITVINGGIVGTIAVFAATKLQAGWLSVLVLVALGPAVLRTARLAAERGRQSLTFHEDHLTVRRGFPMLGSRPIPLAEVSDVRLSQRLLAIASPRVSMKGLVSVDLMAGERHLARLTMNDDEARWMEGKLSRGGRMPPPAMPPSR